VESFHTPGMPEQSDGHPKNIKKGFFQMPTNKVKSAIQV
jgi:hypothetical protein